MAFTAIGKPPTLVTVHPPSYSSNNTPKSAGGTKRVALQPRTRATLQELWWKAEQDFNRENPKHSLGAQIRSDRQGVRIAKNGVLDRWQQRYQPDTTDDAKRKERITRYMSNTLNALELVGSFASQAAASAFPPAGICFSALQFLIDAPKNIQKVYDDLEKLFIQVDRFLMQFSIYQRMDDKFGLDESLITNANKLLVQFVRICGLSIRLLEGGKWQTIKQGFKTVLFSDDGGVQAELDSFESLAKFNNELTDTITLEHVLESEENTKKILRDNGELLAGVGQLLANSNDEKMKFANKDRIKGIRKRLFDGKGPLDEEMSVGVFEDDIVPNTFETIQATSEYQHWDEGDFNSTLVIWGSSGCGKSRFMDAIKQHLDDLRNNADRDLHSIYVAVFSFSEKISKITGRKRFGKSLVPHALRVLALQVAEQSTTYAKDLFLQLETNKIKNNDDDHESVWRSLRLAKLNISPVPRLYILLDAIDEEWEDARTLLKLLEDQRELATLRIKILTTMAGTEDRTEVLTQNTGLALSAASIKAKLLPSLVRSKMTEMGIFQDPEKSSRRVRQKIFEGLTQPHVTFRDALEKLDKIKAAIENSAPRSIITDVLEERSAGSTAKEGQAVVTLLETNLNSGDLKLLSSILMWLVGSKGASMRLEVLEAALRLEQADLPIEALEKKIKHTFNKAIVLRGSDVVELQPNVETFLLERHEQTQLEGREPLITLDISIRDATPSIVTQFIWNLHENLVNGNFEFNATNMKARRIHISKLTTHMTIIRLCFKVLTEGWNDDDPEDILWYAQEEIPRQLVLLQAMQKLIGRSDRRMIGEGLIAFLRDTHVFEERHQRYGHIGWMSDKIKVDAFRFWLEDKETMQQLPVKEQRWIANVMDMQNGKLGFLCDLTQSVCKRWLTDRKSPSWDLGQWIYDYSRAVQKWEEEFEAETEQSESESEEDEEEGDDEEEEEGEESQEDDSQEGGIGEGEEADEDISTQGKENSTSGADSLDTKPATSTVQFMIDDSRDVIPDEEKEDLFGYEEVESFLMDTVRKYYEPNKNAAYNYAWGRTWFEDLYPARAAGYFNQALCLAQNEADDESRILVAHILGSLAHCKQTLQNNDAAFELASQSLATFEQLCSDGKLSDAFDAKFYIEQLGYWASVFERRDPDRALQWYEKAYLLAKNEDERLMYLWAVLKLRCHADDSQETALALLEDWTKDRQGSDDSSPALSMLEMVERDNDLKTLLQISCSIHNERLRSLMLQFCAQALRFAGRDLTHINGFLFWMQANICVGSAVINTHKRALPLFENALAAFAQDSQNEEYSTEISSLATSIMKFKFDHLMFDVGTDTIISHKDRLQHKRQLEKGFESVAASHKYLRYERGIESAASYIISFCSLNGMINEARLYCKDQMANALEILSDSDPENDREGAKTLLRIFCFLDDRARMLIAFSLLDRQINLKLLQNAGDAEAAVSLEEKINNGMLRLCNGCDKIVYSSDDSGIWCCRYCPDLDLCTDCKLKHDSGDLKMMVCNPAHASAFFHLVHTDYTLEELDSGGDDPKVMIDFTYKTVPSARGGYSRSGGKIVSLKEWVEQLRKEWDLPQPFGGSSRAQK